MGYPPVGPEVVVLGVDLARSAAAHADYTVAIAVAWGQGASADWGAARGAIVRYIAQRGSGTTDAPLFLSRCGAFDWRGTQQVFRRFKPRAARITGRPPLKGRMERAHRSRGACQS
jgi:hypothetical protein